MTPEDKIAAAIERNTEAIDKFRSEVGSVGMWLFFIWIVLLSGVGCPRAKAAPLLPPLGYEIGEPPSPPPNPNVQYWYTMDVPGPQGVLPVEVFAPRLVAHVASEPAVETPEPGTAEMLALALLIVALTASVRWRIHAWLKKRKAKRKAQEDAIARHHIPPVGRR